MKFPKIFKPYKKLIAFVVGVSTILVLRKFDLYIPGIESILQDMFISVITGMGIYQVKNEPHV